MTAWLRLIRLPNLLIIGLAQYLVRFTILHPIFTEAGISFDLSELNFSILVLSTITAAASGYLINDYFDIEIDKINKPNKVLVGKAISKRSLIRAYFLFIAFCVSLALYLMYQLDLFEYFFIFPVVLLSLWWYAYELKKKFVIGNVMISIFISLTILLVWLAEIRSYDELLLKDLTSARTLTYTMSFYAIFAFLANLFREIVKDVEDIEGDRMHNSKSLVIVAGETAASYSALLTLIILLCALAYFNFLFKDDHGIVAMLYAGLAIGTYTLYMIFLLMKASGKDDYSSLSRHAKYLMLVGLLYPATIYFL